MDEVISGSSFTFNMDPVTGIISVIPPSIVDGAAETRLNLIESNTGKSAILTIVREEMIPSLALDPKSFPILPWMEDGPSPEYYSYIGFTGNRGALRFFAAPRGGDDGIGAFPDSVSLDPDRSRVSFSTTGMKSDQEENSFVDIAVSTALGESDTITYETEGRKAFLSLSEDNLNWTPNDNDTKTVDVTYTGVKDLTIAISGSIKWGHTYENNIITITPPPDATNVENATLVVIGKSNSSDTYFVDRRVTLSKTGVALSIQPSSLNWNADEIGGKTAQVTANVGLASITVTDDGNVNEGVFDYNYNPINGTITVTMGASATDINEILTVHAGGVSVELLCTKPGYTPPANE